MQPTGARVSLRAVVGGMTLLWIGHIMWEASENGYSLWVLGGCFVLLFLSALGLAMMFHATRNDRGQRGLRLWFLATLKLTGTLMIGFLAFFVVMRGYELLTR